MSRVFVTGATGAQGGAVARSLCARGYTVRALTRNPASRAARELAQLGVELVQADLSDLGALIELMRGCAAAFGVTDFWEHFGCEVAHGRNLVDAARAVGCEHLVLSTLLSSSALSRGELLVPHMETKHEIECYARASGQVCTFVHVAFYFENFCDHFPPLPAAGGGYELGFPLGDAALAAIGVSDLGPIVATIIEERARFSGMVVEALADERSAHDYAAVMTRVLGRDIRYRHIPVAQYAALGFTGAEELAQMFDLKRRFMPRRTRELALIRTLHPAARDFETWLIEHRERFLSLLDEAAPQNEGRDGT